MLDRRRQGGLQIIQDLELPASGRALDPLMETTVYRLVQEALTNMVKHARATTARVAVRLDGGAVTVRVCDDGTGFDPAAGTAGFGLAGMRERVYLAGGTLEVRSGATGTVVAAELPVSVKTGRSDGDADGAPAGARPARAPGAG